MTKYGVTSGPCFPILSPNTGKYGPEISPYLDTSHAVMIVDILSRFRTYEDKMQHNLQTSAFFIVRRKSILPYLREKINEIGPILKS